MLVSIIYTLGVYFIYTYKILHLKTKVQLFVFKI